VTVDVKDVCSAELKGNLVETTTDLQQYEKTDRQISETASMRYKFLSGEKS
jgi:hypothetical protein